jgi:hypothetical protein
MTDTPPKPKRRRWRWLVLTLFIGATGCPGSNQLADDMTDFKPIDHKDSDAEYRANVRKGIELSLGTTLTVASTDALIGDWERTAAHRPSQPALRFTYFADGTFRSPYDSKEAPRRRWKIADGVYTELAWEEPMPEHDIHEGSWTPEEFHCAVTSTGSIAIWNGDGSMLLLLTRIEK